MNMRWFVPFGVALCAATFLTGCFDSKDEYVLNPDGSGKVVHECRFQRVNLSDQEENTEAALKEEIAKILSQSKGVDAWKDVSYKRLEDGRLYFKGTAYFKSLSQFEVANQGIMLFTWKTNGDGTMSLGVRTNKSDSGSGIRIRKSPTSAAALSPEEMDKKLKEERGRFKQMQPMLAGILSGMKQTTTLQLPGKVKTVSNFTRQPDGTIKIEFEGAKLAKTMETLMNDDEWAKKYMSSGRDMQDPPAFDDAVNGMMFGTKAAINATVDATSKATFDYASEVALAKKEFEKIQKDLGAGSLVVAPPAQGEPLKSVKVVGVRMVGGLDKKLELRPFSMEEGYSLAILAELPGSVLTVTGESKIESAIADDGSDLLPENEWKRKIHFPRLSADKSSVLIEVELKLPGKGVKGVKEISGNLNYKVSSGTKEIDLGITELKPGASGTELGAQIKGIKEGWQKNGTQELDIKLNIGMEAMKEMYMVVDGNKTKLSKRGSSGYDKSATFTFELKEAFPAKARLVAEVYDQLKTFDAPFKVANITLFGTPAK